MNPYYSDGSAMIYHADCRDVLPTIQAEMAVTDPPYGVNYTGGTTEREPVIGDKTCACYEWALPMLRRAVDGPLYVFAPDIALPVIVEAAGSWLRSVIVWRKQAQYGALGAHYKQANEFLAYAVPPGAPSRWAGPTTETTDWYHERPDVAMHPTQKPLAVCARAIRNHSASTVLDPFMGSGTTLVAAKNLGRASIGIEVDERNCEMAAERLSQCLLIVDAGGPPDVPEPALALGL